MVKGVLKKVKQGSAQLDDSFLQTLENLPKFKKVGKVMKIVPS